MKKLAFVRTYYPFANQTFNKKGIPVVAILAQAALESGWGKHAPGNMFFGVKDRDGKNGNEQLLQTVEYSRRADLKFPVIISVTPTVRNGIKMFRYVVKDYFRKYNTPEESFTDHADFFFKNKRYAKALSVKEDSIKFLRAVSDAGYATDPNYRIKITSIAKEIENHIKLL